MASTSASASLAADRPPGKFGGVGGWMTVRGTIGSSRVCFFTTLVSWYETGASLLGKGW